MSSNRLPLVSGTNLMKSSAPAITPCRSRTATRRARRSRPSAPRCDVLAAATPSLIPADRNMPVRTGAIPGFCGNVFVAPLAPREAARYVHFATGRDRLRGSPAEHRLEGGATSFTRAGYARGRQPSAIPGRVFVGQIRCRPTRHLASSAGRRAPALDVRACRGAPGSRALPRDPDVRRD